MRYQHIVVYWVKGLSSLQSENDEEIIVDSANNFRVILTNDPDTFCFEGDRSTAIANLMLNSMFGQVQSGTFHEQLEETASGIKQSRKQKLGAGSYLIFFKDGNVDEFTPSNQGENEEFVICFDGASKEPIRQASEPYIITALSTLMLAASNTQGVLQVSDEVVFFRDDNKPVYCYTPSLSGTLSVSQCITLEEVSSVSDLYKILIANQNLERVVRLLVSSLKTDNDVLRSFLFGWMALEIFINKAFIIYEPRFFNEISIGHFPEVLPQFLDRIQKVIKGKDIFSGNDFLTILRENSEKIRSEMRGNKYGLSAKFALVVSFIALESAEEDVKEFMTAKKQRDDLLHGQNIVEAKLPVEAVQKLTRKYLQLHLAIQHFDVAD